MRETGGMCGATPLLTVFLSLWLSLLGMGGHAPVLPAAAAPVDRLNQLLLSQKTPILIASRTTLFPHAIPSQAENIALAALEALAKEGRMAASQVAGAVEQLGLDPEKPNPVSV